MTQRLYRIVLVTTAIVWWQAGMRVSHAATLKDAGSTPEASEWIALVLLLVLGTVGVAVLWQRPATGTRSSADAPAA